MVRAQAVTVHARQLAVTTPGSNLLLLAGEAGLQALVLRGRPLGEPVVHYGPFVMNTQEQIEQAISDYQSGSFA